MNNLHDKTAITNSELTKLLIKKFRIKTGYYELSIDFTINAGGIAGPEAKLLPGITVGVNGFSLAESTLDNKNAINAANVK